VKKTSSFDAEAAQREGMTKHELAVVGGDHRLRHPARSAIAPKEQLPAYPVIEGTG
jgi:hypothetical protein